jgi:hypothetical protein
MTILRKGLNVSKVMVTAPSMIIIISNLKKMILLRFAPIAILTFKAFYLAKK